MLERVNKHSFVFHPRALGPPLTALPGARSEYVQQGYDRSLEVQRPRTRTACFSGYFYTQATLQAVSIGSRLAIFISPMILLFYVEYLAP